MLVQSHDMGFQEKHIPGEGGWESEGKRWVITSIPPQPPVRVKKTRELEKGEEEEEEGERESTTPTAKAARIQERLPCPPAPRKRKPPLRCQLDNVEYFNPPELETVFVRR